MREPQPAGFQTTQWSDVLATREGSSEQAGAALENLCRAYWYPLYAFVRREGRTPADAQDLTQAFFARLLERRDFEHVRRERGRLRSYLLAALRHFLANEWERARAQKRGGALTFVPLDEAHAETRYAREPAAEFSAESIYERRWALTVIETALGRLEHEQAAAGQAERFAALKASLLGEADPPPRAETAARLGLNENALKQTLFRLRQRFRTLLREEIAATVASPLEIEEELGFLVAALRR
jgi:RNA polymerase sigma factor (sigma-70 family)